MIPSQGQRAWSSSPAPKRPLLLLPPWRCLFLQHRPINPGAIAGRQQPTPLSTSSPSSTPGPQIPSRLSFLAFRTQTPHSPRPSRQFTGATAQQMSRGLRSQSRIQSKAPLFGAEGKESLADGWSRSSRERNRCSMRRERRKGRSTKGTACASGGDLLQPPPPPPRSHMGVVFVLVLLGCGWIGHGHCWYSSGGCGSSCSCRCLAPRQHSSDAPHHQRLPKRHRSLGVFGCSSCCCSCSCSCFCSCCGSAAAKNRRQKSRSRQQKGPAVAGAAVTPAGPLPSEAPVPQGYLAYSV